MRVDSTSLVGVAAVAQHFRTNFTSPSVRIAGPPGDSVAYVTFVTHEEANRAMQERGNFEGRSLKLSWAKVEDLKSYGSDSDVSLMSIDEWPGSGQLFNNHVKRRNRQKERKKKKRAFTWARRLPGINK